VAAENAIPAVAAPGSHTAFAIDATTSQLLQKSKTG
jgi:hypothetical protein